MSKRTAKQRADKYFSLYIRARDTDHTGMAECITCGKPTFNPDAGHFVARNHEATRYWEENAHAQCQACNRFHSGRQFEHGKAIDKKYGEGTAEKILEMAGMRCKRTEADYNWIAKEFREKYNQIK